MVDVVDDEGEGEEGVENNLKVSYDGECCLLPGNKGHCCCPYCSKLDTDYWVQCEWVNLKLMLEREVFFPMD